jgi:tagatose 1,6-diphosphate aldolase
MTQTLTPGKWRGLVSTSDDNHTFTIMAFDQRGTYERMLPENTPYDTAVRLKQEVVSALSPNTSAVLLDSTYGLSAALNMCRNSGLLMALEKSGYAGSATERQLEFDPDWTVAKIKKTGAGAVKLLAYYHPDSGDLATELENTVRQVATACDEYDIPLFVEPMSYSLDENISKDSAEFAKQRPEIVRETARRFSQLGTTVLKLEFPIDAAFENDENIWRSACEAVSEVSTVPWVLLSAGVNFDVFEHQVEIACRAGASGFLGGRAIWKECIGMAPAERQQFLNSTAQDRLKRLNDLTHKLARPWTDFYTQPAINEHWYVDYS